MVELAKAGDRGRRNRPTEATGLDWSEIVPADQWGWLSALLDAADLHTALFDFACGVAGFTAAEADWSRVTQWLIRNGLAEVIDDRQVRLNVRGRTAVIAELHRIADPAPFRRRFVEHWLDEPDPALVEQVADWAVRLKAWNLLQAIWLRQRQNQLSRAAHRTPDAYRNVPEKARARYPVLSWARAVANAESGDGGRARSTFARTLLRDSVVLHPQWQSQPDADSAVLSGTMWMAAQRLLPSADGQGAVEASWRTRTAIRRRIETETEAGHGPSALAQTVFAAFSAQVALARGDLLTAIAEARTAQLIGAGGRGLNWFAAGLEAVSDALFGVRTEPHFVPRLPPVRRWDPGEGDLRESGAAMLELARALRALDRLDEPTVSECLGRARVPGVFGSATRPIRVMVDTLHEAMWGVPPRAIEKLSDSVLGTPDAAETTVEPLSRMLLGGTRAAVLNLIGAEDLASEAAALVPEPVRWSSEARCLLWRGEYKNCVQTAHLGLLKEGNWQRLRTDLLLIKAAALAVDPTAASTERERTVRVSINRAWRKDRLLALGLLPGHARAALLDCFAALAEGEERHILEVIRARVDAVIERDHAPSAMLLTRREQVLLPLLATAESVPEIAATLQVSPNTVRKQVVTLRAKFHAATRAELIRNARAAGVLK